MRDIHRRIKTAFDPDGILSSRLALLTPKDIEGLPAADEKKTEEAKILKNLEEKFWM